MYFRRVFAVRSYQFVRVTVCITAAMGDWCHVTVKLSSESEREIILGKKLFARADPKSGST